MEKNILFFPNLNNFNFLAFINILFRIDIKIKYSFFRSEAFIINKKGSF